MNLDWRSKRGGIHPGTHVERKRIEREEEHEGVRLVPPGGGWIIGK